MATTFGFFSDAGLTTPLGAGITATQKADVSVVDPVVTQVWFGSLGSAGADTEDVKLERASDPGVDQISFHVIAVGNAVHTTSEVKLSEALPGDWGVITPGGSISVGPDITSGTANAISIYVYVDDETNAVSLLTELSIATDTLLESPAV